MFNRLTETFLNEYFLADAVLGEFYQKDLLFSVLGRIFCLPDGEEQKLFNLTQSEAVCEITTEDGFKRYKRIKQYNQLVGNDCGYTKCEEQLIAIKGNAITIAAKYYLTAAKEGTSTLVVKTIMDGAENGNVVAMRMLGILKCEGLLVERDIYGGVCQLTKAMQWGDVTATLAMFAYSDRDKTHLLRVLNASVRNTPYEFLPRLISEKYGVNGEECDREVLLIKQAFNTNRLSKDTFDPMYARLIFSEAIGIKDKERILFSENKEAISETCDLPLRLKYGDITIDEDAFKSILSSRDKEKAEVIRALYYSDLRFSDTFRPMCLCSDSEYVLERYASAICNALRPAHIERIEVGELRDFDFEPTKNSVFLRGLHEDKNNVHLLIFKGDISDGAIELTKTVLKSEKRRKFHLYRPTLTLDLSGVLPICICDRENAQRLKNLVEIIELDAIKSAEKADVIDEIVSRICSFYKLDKASITCDAVQRLCSLPVESAEKVIDRAIRENRRVGPALHLDMELIRTYLDKNVTTNNCYGFGGVNDENK